jgi:hypothetical protein
MKAPTKGSRLKGALLTGILSLGMAGSLISAKPADAAPRWCKGHYENQRVWVSGRDRERYWVPARWVRDGRRSRYIAGHWDWRNQNQGRYVVKRVWVSNC